MTTRRARSHRAPLVGIALALAMVASPGPGWALPGSDAGSPGLPHAPADTQPPTRPGNLRATPSATGATLAWTASRDNVGVKHYLVTVAGKVLKPTTTSVTVSGLMPNTSYTATVKAVDAAGNTSTAARVTFRTTTAGGDTQAPTKPGSLSAATGPTSARLTWSAATDNVGVSAYAITANGRTTTTVVTRETLNGLQPGTTYTATVSARDAAGNVSPAATVTFTTLPMPDSPSIHVSPSGSDSNPGTAASPLRTIQAAADRAFPGATILLDGGTYTSPASIRLSVAGEGGRPITIKPAGTGAVTVTHPVVPMPCNNSQPAQDRTFLIMEGAEHWTIEGLTIHNGIWANGREANAAYSWLTRLVNAGNWQTRRAAPGHGTNDVDAARNNLVPFLRTATGEADLAMAEGIRIRDNVLTGRGVYVALISDSEITGNTVKQIPCGIGPGIWVMTFSHDVLIANNDVSDIAASTAAHYMQEGIRLGSAANYNEIRNNAVHDLPGDGRGINTDVDASWNYFHHNTVRNVSIGYNDQMSGWGNRWEYNTATNYRTYGFGFRLMDAKLAQPSMHSSTNKSVIKCNTTSGAVGGAKALGAGALMNTAFVGNDMPAIWLSANLKRYWSAKGNTWNGSSALPPDRPPHNSAGC